VANGTIRQMFMWLCHWANLLVTAFYSRCNWTHYHAAFASSNNMHTGVIDFEVSPMRNWNNVYMILYCNSVCIQDHSAKIKAMATTPRPRLQHQNQDRYGLVWERSHHKTKFSDHIIDSYRTKLYTQSNVCAQTKSHGSTCWISLEFHKLILTLNTNFK